MYHNRLYAYSLRPSAVPLVLVVGRSFWVQDDSSLVARLILLGPGARVSDGELCILVSKPWSLNRVSWSQLPVQLVNSGKFPDNR